MAIMVFEDFWCDVGSGEVGDAVDKIVAVSVNTCELEPLMVVNAMN